jgi:hypothetical protein
MIMLSLESSSTCSRLLVARSAATSAATVGRSQDVSFVTVFTKNFRGVTPSCMKYWVESRASQPDGTGSGSGSAAASSGSAAAGVVVPEPPFGLFILLRKPFISLYEYGALGFHF